jgi:hypothetical protein
MQPNFDPTRKTTSKQNERQSQIKNGRGPQKKGRRPKKNGKRIDQPSWL